MKTKAVLLTLVILVVTFLIYTVSPSYAGPRPRTVLLSVRPLGDGLTVGQLQPGGQEWYQVNSASLKRDTDHLVVFNMVYRPGSHDVTPYVNFQVFTEEQLGRWLQGSSDAALGIGIFTTTDFDPDSAERIWTGSLLREETYYVRLFNNSATPVEYHLMTMSQPAQIVVAEPAVAGGEQPYVQPAAASIEANAPAVSGMGPSTSDAVLKPAASPDEARRRMIVAAIQSMSPEEAVAWLALAEQAGLLPGNAAATVPKTSPEEAPAAVNAPTETNQPSAEAAPAERALSPAELYPSVYPNRPLVLHDGANVGRLAPGGEHWYAFIRQDFDKQRFEHMALTMFATPTDGNRSHHINFQIYPASQLHIWLRGTPNAMVPMGQGQWVERDKDPLTGERLWSGDVVDGDTYYVRVFNHSDQVIDYYLITNDVINTELGERVFSANQFYPYVLYPPNSPAARNR
ncbi:MAG: hypothetical protein DDG58_09640 [Ardenticatenia bacterium]|jgi:hypothetical protein|nr:MAG: hypothetical protein DDG58_09640 [Ardenticatenia bacterium]